jgi:branched-chain amino acid transport system permease protein
MTPSGASGNGLLRVRRSTHSPVYTIVGSLIIVALLSVAPWIVPAEWSTVLQNFFILVTMATMWNLLAGYAGMVSIGQQAFVGLGAYATLFFALKGMNPFYTIPLAAITCVVIAYPVTFLLFRLRGGYFAVATWVVASTAGIIIVNEAYLGGGTGESLPRMPDLNPTSLQHLIYLVTWGVALIVVTSTYFLLRSRLGLVLASIRDNEISARSSGTKVTSARRTVFLIAAAGTGAAGAVLALSQTYLQTTNEFNLQWAAEMLFVSMIGGLGTIEGPILGCIIFFALQQSLAQQGAWYLIIFGTVAVVVALWQPRGLWGAFRDRFHVELLPVGHWVGDRKSEMKVRTSWRARRASKKEKKPPT